MDIQEYIKNRDQRLTNFCIELQDLMMKHNEGVPCIDLVGMAASVITLMSLNNAPTQREAMEVVNNGVSKGLTHFKTRTTKNEPKQ